MLVQVFNRSGTGAMGLTVAELFTAAKVLRHSHTAEQFCLDDAQQQAIWGL